MKRIICLLVLVLLIGCSTPSKEFMDNACNSCKDNRCASIWLNPGVYNLSVEDTRRVYFDILWLDCGHNLYIEVFREEDLDKWEIETGEKHWEYSCCDPR